MSDINDLLNSTDAMEWAEVFMSIHRNRLDEIDEGLMLCWFANAMAAQEMALADRGRASMTQTAEVAPGIFIDVRRYEDRTLRCEVLVAKVEDGVVTLRAANSERMLMEGDVLSISTSMRID